MSTPTFDDDHSERLFQIFEDQKFALFLPLGIRVKTSFVFNENLHYGPKRIVVDFEANPEVKTNFNFVFTDGPIKLSFTIKNDVDFEVHSENAYRYGFQTLFQCFEKHENNYRSDTMEDFVEFLVEKVNRNRPPIEHINCKFRHAIFKTPSNFNYSVSFCFVSTQIRSQTSGITISRFTTGPKRSKIHCYGLKGLHIGPDRGEPFTIASTIGNTYSSAVIYINNKWSLDDPVVHAFFGLFGKSGLEKIFEKLDEEYCKMRVQNQQNKQKFENLQW